MANVTNDRTPVVGVIDPVTGQYSKLATFKLSTDSAHDGSFARVRVQIAPDYRRVADTRNRHAGWIDVNGVFTDVNAGADSTPGPFGGNAPTYAAIGFNGRGDFYYEKTSTTSKGGEREVYKISNGQTTGGVKEPTNELLAARIVRDGLGELVSAAYTCLSTAEAWVPPADYLYVKEFQVYRLNIAQMPRDFSGCYNSRDASLPLLPTENTSKVSNPVISPDGTRVAFRRNVSELWIVNSGGGAEPAPVPIKGMRSPLDSDTFLLGWTSAPITG